MAWVTDTERLARWFNPAWCDFVGSPLDDELGWGWMRHVHPDDLVPLLEAYEAGHVNRHGFEYVGRVVHRSGDYRRVRVRAVPRTRDDAFDGFIGICVPIETADEPIDGTRLADLLPPTDEPSTLVVERLANLEAALEVSRPAERPEVACLRRLAATWAAEHPWLRDRQDDIALAVTEAAANAVVHGYRASTGDVHLTCAIGPERAAIRIRDWGSWEAPSGSAESRGIPLMPRLCDEFELRHLPDGTEAVLRYRR
jgi:anti-sigma regulatory factor (Ser/Thr protein kinase)